ncbi:S-layer homology domain-containing protein [Ureibacillus chungkukjangi]|uniref:CAP and S-layer homology domain-containing protein n=1 Tax=Ureibacillus chungkukjangi TaxID=1202712 RepID=UPI00384A638C
MKKLIQLLTISVTIFFIMNVSVQANDNMPKLYSDFSSSHWAYEYVATMKENGIIMGQPDGKFYPEKPITRAEAVQYIYNAMDKKPMVAEVSTFEDVPKNATYKEAINALSEIGAIQKSKKFNPDGYLTRAQLAKMISIAFQVEDDQKNKVKFTDVTSSNWAKHYIESLADIGVLKGTGSNYFSPHRNVTRVQMSAILGRILDFKEQLTNYEIIYDFLQKDYIPTVNQNQKWINEVVTLVNAERKKQGLKPLVYDKRLGQIAVVKANDMIQNGYFDHQSPLYGYPWDMAGIFDYSFTSFGENIAKNFTSSNSVVDAWLKSTKHRENILKNTYTNIGVSCIKGKDGKYYWVQLFSST